MIKPKYEIKRVIVISVLIIILISGSLVLYSNYRIQKLNEEFNTKLLLLNKDIITNLNQLRQSLDEDIFSLQNNLTLEMDLIDSSLKRFREKNKQELDTLNSLIEEIERQSNIQLGELKEEISTIQVESKDFSSIIDDVIQSVVSVGTNRGQGSGAIIDDRGFIVTNYHVIENANLFRILTYDGQVYDAVLVGYNEFLDVAVLKVDADLESLRFGDSDDVKVGEKVIALGNPVGLAFTVTEGIVSALGRRGPNNQPIYIQTDVPINPGNSGGPLVNTGSRIIGINNFKIGGFEGLGFAIESNVVENVTNDIISQYLEQT